MSNYDETNRGAVWRNQHKKSDNHPDLSGRINVDGKEYWLNGWTKKPDANEKAPVVSFAVRPVEDQAPAPKPQPTQASPAGDFTDDIPW